MKTIDIITVYHSGDHRPTYALGAAWDQAQHYFTDYTMKERHTYALPDGYEVAEDASGAYHIYPITSSWPCEIGRTHGDWLPCILDDGKRVPLHLVEEAR